MDALLFPRSAAFVSAAAEALAVQIHAAGAARRLRALWAEFGGSLEGARVLLAIALWEMQAAPNAAQAAAARAELGQMLDPAARWTLRTLAPLTGCPRETLRRELLRLADEGWLRRVGRTYELAPRTRRRLAGPLFDALAADLCATAALIDVLRQGGAAADAQVAQLHAAALATDPAALLAPAAPPPLASRKRAEFLGFLLSQFTQLAQTCKDDLLLPLLLAEVAQRNFAVLLAPQADTLAELVEGLREGFVERARHHPAARASNGYSLSQCLGIPHETVRRRVAELVEHGFLERDDKGLLWCRAALLVRFATRNREREAELMRMAGRLQGPSGNAQSRGDAGA